MFGGYILWGNWAPERWTRDNATSGDEFGVALHTHEFGPGDTSWKRLRGDLLVPVDHEDDEQRDQNRTTECELTQRPKLTHVLMVKKNKLIENRAFQPFYLRTTLTTGFELVK